MKKVVRRVVTRMYLLKAFFDQIEEPSTSAERHGYLAFNDLSCTPLKLYTLLDKLCARGVCQRVARGKYQSVLT